jgi:urease accessory protein UreH
VTEQPWQPAPAFCFDVTLARGRDGRTRLARRSVSHPWSLGRSFPAEDDPGAATLIPQAAAAGLLAGDVHRQRVRLEAGASARLVAAGATMVYGAGDGRIAESAWRFEIGSGARLEHRAEPYVLHGPARLRSTQTVVLAETGCCLTWDAVVFSGDRAAAWTAELVVESPEGAALLIDAQRAAPGALARQGAPPGCWRAFGALHLLAPAAPRAALERAAASGLAGTRSGVFAAAAPLAGALGLGLRIAARDGGRLRGALHDMAGRLMAALDTERGQGE